MKLAVICFLVLTIGCDRAANKPVCIVAINGVMETFPLELAQDLGYFREEGVAVNIEHAAKVSEAVLSGSCEMSFDGYVATIQATTAGQKLKAFLVVGIRPTTVLVVAPKNSASIRTLADLKGKLVGVNVFGGATEMNLKHALKQNAIANSDVTLIQTGSGPKAVAALERGKVDAAFTSTTVLAVLRRRVSGVNTLLDLRTPDATKAFFGVDAIGGYSLNTKPEWLAEHPEQARRIARAMVRTLRWAREHPLEEVYSKLQPIYRSDDKQVDMAVLEIIISTLSTDGKMPQGGAEAMQRVTAEKVLGISLSR